MSNRYGIFPIYKQHLANREYRAIRQNKTLGFKCNVCKEKFSTTRGRAIHSSMMHPIRNPRTGKRGVDFWIRSPSFRLDREKLNIIRASWDLKKNGLSKRI